MHWACVAVDDTPHQPKHWPERVVPNANLETAEAGRINFLHIPKTGGTTIEAVARDAGYCVRVDGGGARDI